MTSRVVDRLRLVHRALRYRFKLNRPQISAMLVLLPEAGVAIDVGAHKGAYSYWMARRVGRSGRVLAFEPQSRLAARTAGTLQAAGFTQVRFRHAAVSDRYGRGTITFRMNSTHGASLQGFDGAAELLDQEQVEIITIDAAVRQEALGRVDFVKIDVEGHKLAVLRGSEQTMAEHRPAILVELEARHHAGDNPVEAAAAHMASRGYTGYFFTRRGLRAIAEFNAAAHQEDGEIDYCNDFLFLHGPPGDLSARG